MLQITMLKPYHYVIKIISTLVIIYPNYYRVSPTAGNKNYRKYSNISFSDSSNEDDNSDENDSSEEDSTTG